MITPHTPTRISPITVVLFVLLLVVFGSCFAEIAEGQGVAGYRVCGTFAGPTYTSPDEPCEVEIIQHMYACGTVRNEPDCIPPPTFVAYWLASPLNAPVEFVGARTRKGRVEWLWKRIGDPTGDGLPDDRGAYEAARRVRIGEILYTTSPFFTIPR